MNEFGAQGVGGDGMGKGQDQFGWDDSAGINQMLPQDDAEMLPEDTGEEDAVRLQLMYDRDEAEYDTIRLWESESNTVGRRLPTPDEFATELIEAGPDSAAAMLGSMDPGPETAAMIAMLRPAVLAPASVVSVVAATEKLLSWVQARQHRWIAAFACPDVVAPRGALKQYASQPGQPLHPKKAARSVEDGQTGGGQECAEGLDHSESAVHGDPDVDAVLTEVALNVAAAEIGAALHFTPVTAKRRVCDAVNYAIDLPATLKAMEAGVIDRGRAGVIADRTQNLPVELRRRVERSVLPKATSRTPGQVRGIVDRAVISVDPQAAKKRHQRAISERNVTYRAGEDGIGVFRAEIAADKAQVAYSIIDQLADQLNRAPKGVGDHDARGVAAFRADIFSDLFDQLACTGTITLHGTLIRQANRVSDHGLGRQHSGSGDIGDVSSPGYSERPMGGNGTDESIGARKPAGTAASPIGTGAADLETLGVEVHAGAEEQADIKGDLGKPDAIEKRDDVEKLDGVEEYVPVEHADLEEPDAVEECVLEEKDVEEQDQEKLESAPPDAAQDVAEELFFDRSAGVEQPDHVQTDGEVPAMLKDSGVGQFNDEDAKWGTLPSESPESNSEVHRHLGTHHGRHTHLNVTIAESTLAGRDDRPCELEGQGPIPADLARAIAISAETIMAIVLQPGCGTGLDLGRTSYRPRLAQRDYVTTRDQTCRFPGCRRDAKRCQIDHSNEFCPGRKDGGVTCPCNLCCLCAFHHGLKTGGLWDSVQHPDASITWTSPTGREYITRPRQWPTEHDDEPIPRAGSAVPLAADPALAEHPGVNHKNESVVSADTSADAGSSGGGLGGSGSASREVDDDPPF